MLLFAVFSERDSQHAPCWVIAGVTNIFENRKHVPETLVKQIQIACPNHFFHGISLNLYLFLQCFQNAIFNLRDIELYQELFTFLKTGKHVPGTLIKQIQIACPNHNFMKFHWYFIGFYNTFEIWFSCFLGYSKTLWIPYSIASEDRWSRCRESRAESIVNS